MHPFGQGSPTNLAKFESIRPNFEEIVQEAQHSRIRGDPSKEENVAKLDVTFQVIVKSGLRREEWEFIIIVGSQVTASSTRWGLSG